jgi:Anti-sigma-K factor rskA
MICSEYLAGRLNGDESVELAAHRAVCAACSAGDAELALVRELLTDADTWSEPDPDLEQKVMAAVTAAGETAESDADPGSSGPSTPPPVLRVADAPARNRWRWLGWAAVVVIAAGAVIPLLRANEPDWEVTLTGTGPTPEASATVVGWGTEAGTRMQLDAIDLPPAPEGYVYEMWMSNDDTHISAGSFRAGDAVDLWTGVRRSDFPHLWVTLEPIDSNPAANGEAVLDLDA